MLRLRNRLLDALVPEARFGDCSRIPGSQLLVNAVKKLGKFVALAPVIHILRAFELKLPTSRLCKATFGVIDSYGKLTRNEVALPDSFHKSSISL